MQGHVLVKDGNGQRWIPESEAQQDRYKGKAVKWSIDVAAKAKAKPKAKAAPRG